MKNHRFLWLRNRTTNNRKCEKARNIKEKRTIEMFNTVSRQLVEHHSSLNVNFKVIRESKNRRSSACSALCILHKICTVSYTLLTKRTI